MILGIDASLTNTAVVRGDGRNYEVATFSSDPVGDLPKGRRVRGRIARFDGLVDRVITWLSDRTSYDAIFIEAYSLGHARPGTSEITEFGGILRWHLDDLSDRIYEVAPMTLKKFVTGSGAGKKLGVVSYLTKDYGVMFATDDEYDAFGLYRLGLVAEGLTAPATQAQREAADTAIGAAPAKKKSLKPRSVKPSTTSELLW